MIVYFHIGLDKTGTTAIQEFLRRERRQLAARGLHVPSIGDLRTHQTHHAMAEAFLGSTNARFLKPGKREDFLQALSANIREAGMPITVVSSESLCRADMRIGDFIGFAEQFDYRIIAFVRRQDEYLRSRYAKQVEKLSESAAAARDVPTMQEFEWDPSMFRLDLGRFVKQWEAYIDAPEKRLIVHPYQKQQIEGGLIRKFLENVGFDAPDLAPEEPAGEIVNGSYSDARLSAILEVLKSDAPAGEKSERIRRIREESAEDAGEAVFRRNLLMPAEEKRRMLDRYAGGNAYIARRYLGRDWLFDTSDLGGAAAGAEG